MARGKTTPPFSGDRTAPAPDRGAAASAGSLFISVEQLAERVGVSRNLLLAQIERGELRGVQRIGRRILIAWPAWQLAALALSPEDFGHLLAGLGVRDLAGVLAFLNGDGGVS
jgi:excisionase family DNA binding protein